MIDFGARVLIYFAPFDSEQRGEVAQSVEQRTHKPWVEGSIPSFATNHDEITTSIPDSA